MRRKSLPLLTATLCVATLWLSASPAAAQWPTSVRQNLPIAADTTLPELSPVATALSGGAILTVFQKWWSGLCYQITTRYGEPTFTPFALLSPATSTINAYDPQLVANPEGGAYVAWLNTTPGYHGLWAQRLDSAGNRLWGDAAVRVHDYYPTASYFSICPDGMGGLILAYHSNGTGDMMAQRISPDAQLRWDPNGVVVCQYPYQQMDPRPAHDGAGGAYVVWWDFRPPYSGQGAPWMQKLDSLGQICWAENGILAHNGTPYLNQPLADGEGGLLLLTGTGLPNTVYRYSASGDSLWRRSGVCTWMGAQIHLGEPGYFYYLGWDWEDFRAQRMDLDGNTYWPSFGSLMGIPLASVAVPNLTGVYAYQFPYFYAVMQFEAANGHRELYAQKVDAGMNRYWERGAPMTATPSAAAGGGIEKLIAVPDGRGGVTGVWEQTNGSLIHDIWAKHLNPDGRRGGPEPPQPPPNPRPVD